MFSPTGYRDRYLYADPIVINRKSTAYQMGIKKLKRWHAECARRRREAEKKEEK